MLPRRKHPQDLAPMVSGGALRRWAVPFVAASVLLVGCGFVYWALEPNAPTLADGLWLAFATASTVGYGDIVPSTLAAKLFSVVVVLLGFALLSLVTAAITATFVESDERRIEREVLHDLHRQIGALRAEVTALRVALGHEPPAP